MQHGRAADDSVRDGGMSPSATGRWPHVNWRREDLRRPGKRRVMLETVMLTSLVRMGLLHSDTHLTNLSKFDGGGSQVHQTLAIQAFCAAFGLRYAHAPISAMEHTPEPEMIARWEALFDLGRGLPRVSDLNLPVVRLSAFLRAPRSWRQPQIISALDIHAFINTNPIALDLVRGRAIDLYAGKPPSRASEALTAAVHIRRGDVASGSKRFISTAETARKIGLLRTAAQEAGLPIDVTAFSEGEPQDFPELNDIGVRLQLGNDPLDALNQMVHSDILMMGRSSFSYVAGLLNDRGLVLYETYWHAPMRHWLTGLWESDRIPNTLHSALCQRFGAAPAGPEATSPHEFCRVLR